MTDFQAPQEAPQAEQQPTQGLDVEQWGQQQAEEQQSRHTARLLLESRARQQRIQEDADNRPLYERENRIQRLMIGGEMEQMRALGLDANQVENLWLTSPENRRTYLAVAAQKQAAQAAAFYENPEIKGLFGSLENAHDALRKTFDGNLENARRVMAEITDPQEREQVYSEIYVPIDRATYDEFGSQLSQLNKLMRENGVGSVYTNPKTRDLAAALTALASDRPAQAMMRMEEGEDDGEFAPVSKLADGAIEATVGNLMRASNFMFNAGQRAAQYWTGQGITADPIRGRDEDIEGDIQEQTPFTFDDVYIDADGRVTRAPAQVFGLAEVAGVVARSWTDQQAARYMREMGRVEINNLQDITRGDFSWQGAVNGIAGFTGSIAGALSPAGAIGMAGRSASATQELAFRGLGFIKAGTPKAVQIGRAMGVISGSATMALHNGMSSGKLSDFGEAAKMGAIMWPVMAFTGATGDRLESLLLAGGKKAGGKWESIARAIRGGYEGLGMGAAGSMLGLGLDPLFSIESEEGQLMRNFLNDPTMESFKKLSGYLGTWMVTNMGMGMAMGKGQTQYALAQAKGRQVRRERRGRERERERQFRIADREAKKPRYPDAPVRIEVDADAYRRGQEADEFRPVMPGLDAEQVQEFRTVGELLRRRGETERKAGERGISLSWIGPDVIQQGRVKGDVRTGKMQATEGRFIDRMMHTLRRWNAERRIGKRNRRGWRHGPTHLTELGAVIGRDGDGNVVVRGFKGEKAQVSNWKFAKGEVGVKKELGEDFKEMATLHTHPGPGIFSDPDFHAFSRDVIRGMKFGEQSGSTAKTHFVVGPEGLYVFEAGAHGRKPDDVKGMEKDMLDLRGSRLSVRAKNRRKNMKGSDFSPLTDPDSTYIGEAAKAWLRKKMEGGNPALTELLYKWGFANRGGWHSEGSGYSRANTFPGLPKGITNQDLQRIGTYIRNKTTRDMMRESFNVDVFFVQPENAQQAFNAWAAEGTIPSEFRSLLPMGRTLADRSLEMTPEQAGLKPEQKADQQKREDDLADQGRAELQDTLEADGKELDQRLSEAGRIESTMRDDAESEGVTVEQGKKAIATGFDQQQSYWQSARSYDNAAKAATAHIKQFFSRYFTDKEYRKELAHRLRNTVGYGKRFLSLGRDESMVKAETDVLRTRIVNSQKAVRVARTEIFRPILEMDATPQERQKLIDEVMRYAVLRDIESNATRKEKNPAYEQEQERIRAGELSPDQAKEKLTIEVPIELPFGAPVESFKELRAEMDKTLTAEQRQAYDSMRSMLDKTFQAMADRGLVSPESYRPNYFPHQILDWEHDFPIPGMGTKIPPRTPRPGMVRRREGSRRMFDTSVKAMQDYLFRAEAMMAKHDFLNEVGARMQSRIMRDLDIPSQDFDAMDSNEWRAMNAYLQGNGVYVMDVQQGRVGQRHLERDPFVKNILEKVMAQSGIDMVPEVVVGQNMRPGEGRYLVTKEFLQFSRDAQSPSMWVQSPAIRGINHFIGRWIKGPMLRGFLGTASLPRAARNMLSDLDGIYRKSDRGIRDVIGTLKNMRSARRIITAWRQEGIDSDAFNRLSPMEQSILQELEAHGTLQINVRGQEWTRDDQLEREWMEKTLPQLSRAGRLGEIVSQMYRADFRWAKALDDYSENLLRVGYFMRERMARFDGIMDNADNAKIAREAANDAHLRTGEVLINYNHLTPLERHALNGMVFPFYTWAKSNFFGTLAAVAERPLTQAGRAAMAATPFALWNYLTASEEEERLWNSKPHIAAKPHMILPYMRDEFGNPMILQWESTLGEALKFIGMDQLADDTMQYLVGHGDEEIYAANIVPGSLENAGRAWQSFTAPWLRAIADRDFASAFVTPGEAASDVAGQAGQLSRPVSDLRAMMEWGQKERSAGERWARLAPFVGYVDISEGVPGNQLPFHFQAGRVQRGEARLSISMKNNKKRFTSGLLEGDPEMMETAVERVWDRHGDELTQMGMTRANLMARFLRMAEKDIMGKAMIATGGIISPKWNQLSRSQKVIVLMNMIEKGQQ